MKHIFSLAAFFIVLQAFSQTGTSISGVINIYTPVNAINTCTNTVTVGSAAGFNIGDRVMIIQMKGATIDQTNTPTFGDITSYGGAGTYEMGNIASIAGTTIKFVNKLLYNYNPASLVQLIRVPQYTNAIVNGVLTCQPWNGTTGGVLALEVAQTIYLQANIDVSNKGFAGGNTSVNNGNCNTQNYVIPTAGGLGAYKGEGIVVYSNANGGRGKLADGGGGGDLQNAGGGGGGNWGAGGTGGDGCVSCCGTNLGTGGIGGLAMPYNQNLILPATTLLLPGGGGGGGQQNNSVGTAGGNGGGIVFLKAYTIIVNAGDSILANGNQGVDLASGGSSDGEGGGGAGGTVALDLNIISPILLPISVHGGKGGDNHAGADGPGGGGAGGAVLLSATSINTSVSVDSLGGIAGYNYTTSSNQSALDGSNGGESNSFVIQQSTLLWHGIDTPVVTYNAPACTGNNIQFTLTGNYSGAEVYAWTGPNGFTSTVRNPVITNAAAANSGNYSVFVTDTGCTSPTTTVSITVYPSYAYTVNLNLCSGTVYPLPGGQVISSPGTYVVPLTTVNGCDSTITLNVTFSSVHATGSTTICKGNTTQLNASGALLYSWSPAGSLSSATVSNPVATPTVTTTYTVTGSQPLGNLIVNGDFSLGNVGFSSGYAYTPPPNSNQGQYWVSTNAQVWNGGMATCGDHTTGNGNMLLVNGATSPNVAVYCQTVNVQPNTNYAFSTWLQTLTASNPAQLQFSINGVLLGSVFTASPSNCIWQQFYTVWNSGANTTANICVVNQNTVASGNDFALDDITFSPLCQTTDSITITVNPTYASAVSAGICPGSTYTLPNGTQVGAAGTYIDTLHTIHGCDSIITTNLIVHPVYADSTFPIICPFDIYTLPDGTVTHTSGVYVSHFTSIYGCDSTFTTHLTVIPSTLHAGNDTAICLGDSAQIFATGSLLNNYSWSPRAGLSDSTIANPKASPLQTTTYVVTSQIGSGNLIFNGDFSQGNVGFSTDYNYTTDLYPEGNYYVGANPNTYHSGFGACPDHTTGTGNQMIINGSSATNTNVWCQTISVSPNTNYTFIAWGESVSSGNPAQLQFSIDGSQIGNVFGLPNTPCQWSQFYTTWYSGNNTTANICILNQQTAPGGNDFAIDDISFVSLCVAYDSVTVVVHHPDTITIDTAICAGPTYVFPDGTSSTVSQNDTARFSNRFGCDSTIITRLTVNPIYSYTVTDTICAGAVYTLPNGSTVNNSGTYIDTLPTAHGCDSIITTNLTVLPAPVTNLYDTICQGFTYTRPSGITASTTGIYIDTLTTNGGCDSIVISNLTVHPNSASTQADTVCSGSTVTLPDGTTVGTQGAYPVTLQNQYGCDSVVTTTVTVITVGVTETTTNVLCYGQKTGAIQALAAGGVLPYNYVITLGGANAGSNTTGIFSQLQAGSYVILVTDNFGCNISAPVSISQPDSLELAESLVDVTCFGAHNGQIILSATGGTPAYNFSLNNQNSPNGNYTGLNTGNYTPRVTDANGCTDSTTATITQPQAVHISVSPDSLFVNLGQTIQLTASSNYDPATTYLWTPANGLSCTDCANPVVDITNTMYYNVAVSASINGNTCSADTNIAVTVVPFYDLFIPNAFTPNNDGKNDFFQLFGNLPALKFVHVTIFDRIGELVFESNEINFKWDGTYKGNLLPPGVYVYTLRAVFDDNHTDKLQNGSITLLR